MADLRSAMRDGDVERREAIRMLRAAVKNEEIELRRGLAEDEFHRVLARVVKRHRESIEQFELAKRDDLVAHERAQLAAIERYLPTLMPRAEVEANVREMLAGITIDGPRARGQLMGALAKRLRGKADMKEVSQVVEAMLASTGARA